MPSAIDIHVHIPVPPEYQTENDRERAAAMARYFGGRATEDIDQLAEKYRELDMMAVLLSSDRETTTGDPPLPMQVIADAVEKYPDVFIGFGVVDPNKGAMAVRQLDEIVDLGLKGLGELHGGTQHFYANDPKHYPLWERCEELGLIVLFHTGISGAGAGVAGGGGVKLDASRPIPYIDDIAADFPELRIIMAHPSFPWDREGLAVIRHKPNVYMDLSGHSPLYFDPLVVAYAQTISQDKMLFGSDWPVLTPERWLRDFATYEFEPEVKQKIMHDNAARLLGLAE